MDYQHIDYAASSGGNADPASGPPGIDAVLSGGGGEVLGDGWHGAIVGPRKKACHLSELVLSSLRAHA